MLWLGGPCSVSQTRNVPASSSEFGFCQLGLQRIIALAVPENRASLRVMDRLGMAREKSPVEAFGMLVAKSVITSETWARDTRPSHHDSQSFRSS